MASAPDTTNVVPFPTPPLPAVGRTPELALLLSIYCALSPALRADVDFNLWQLADRGSREARSAIKLLEGNGR